MDIDAEEKRALESQLRDSTGGADTMAELERLARPNWVEADAAAIAQNIAALRRLVGPGVKIFTALKGNACGFGVAKAARVITDAGADALAVVDMADAVRIREAGVRLPVLLYGGNLATAETAAAASAHDLTVTVHDRASAEGFNRHARAPLTAFIELNVGGERLGVEAEEAMPFVQWLQGLENLRIGGIYTHMHVPGGARADRLVRWQFGRFQSALHALDGLGISMPIRMTASSKTLTLTREMNLNAIDPGHLVFGLDPGGAHAIETGVRPALLALKSRILSVRVSARTEYLDDSPFPVREGLRVGVIPMGAADGLKDTRAGAALVRGRRVPWLGPPSAEHARLDLTEVPGAEVDDEVVIIGRQSGVDGDAAITLEEVQSHQGGVRASDITRRILSALPRLYVG